MLKYGSPKLRQASLESSVIPAYLASTITKLPQEEQERVAHECLERGDAGPARAAASKVVRARKNSAATATPVMDARQRFAVVLVDPWRCEPTRLHGDREISNHHSLVPPDKIKTVGRELRKDLLPNAVLFLRVPALRIADALFMM